MSDIAKGFGDLITSIVEIIKGIFTTIFHLFEGVLNTIVGVFKGMFNLTEGVLGFVIGKYSFCGLRLAAPNLWLWLTVMKETSSSLEHWQLSILDTYCTSNDRAGIQLHYQQRRRRRLDKRRRFGRERKNCPYSELEVVKTAFVGRLRIRHGHVSLKNQTRVGDW